MPPGTLTLAGDCATESTGQRSDRRRCIAEPLQTSLPMPPSENRAPSNAVRAKVRQMTLSNFMARTGARVVYGDQDGQQGCGGCPVSGPELPIMLGECYAESTTALIHRRRCLRFPMGAYNTGWTNWNPDSSDIKLVDDVRSTTAASRIGCRPRGAPTTVPWAARISAAAGNPPRAFMLANSSSFRRKRRSSPRGSSATGWSTTRPIPSRWR